jgi:hypothetical protein
VQLAQQVGAKLFLHPIQSTDLANDKDEQRRKLRLLLSEKYPRLPNPPPLSDRIVSACGEPAVSSHGWVDAHLVSALDHNAISFLVTEDLGIHRVCRSLGIEARCLQLSAAVDLLDGERIIAPLAPPAVRSVYVHEMDGRDAIFDSLREDYAPFDQWLEKCKREQRRGWIINIPGRSSYAGVCIVNREDRNWNGSENPTLKICTFKVATDAIGLKLGELLLRAVLDFAHCNDFRTLFIEIYPKYGALLYLLDQFGFEMVEHKEQSGEFVLRKRFASCTGLPISISALEYNRLFGPYAVKWEGVSAYVVPIEPRFHALLFPEMEPQGSLFAGTESFGNTLRKAYLCRAQTRSIRPGDILLFYRSGDLQAITTAGVVEEILPTNEVDKMMEMVKKRTVYERADVEAICSDAGGLGILFRHAPIITRQIPLAKIRSANILSAAPQSITKMTQSALTWVQHHL